LRQFSREISKCEEYSRYRLTANAMATDRERAIAAGCDEFETKPVDMPRLLGKIAAFNGHS